MKILHLNLGGGQADLTSCKWPSIRVPRREEFLNGEIEYGRRQQCSCGFSTLGVHALQAYGPVDYRTE